MHSIGFLSRSFAFYKPNLSFAQKFCTQTAETQSLIYEGPLFSAVRRLKFLSLVSCSATLLGSPFLLASDAVKNSSGASNSEPASDSSFGKYFLTAIVVFFGVGSTALVHWGTKPYIGRLFFCSRKKMFTAEKLNLLAQIKKLSFPLSHVQQNLLINRPFVNFKVKGEPFFVHKEIFNDKNLLKILVGKN
eukprot:Sdes_comp14455_c0_seq1m3492